MSLGTVLLIVLLLVLLGIVPAWPHSRSWGYRPTGLPGVGFVVAWSESGRLRGTAGTSSSSRYSISVKLPRALDRASKAMSDADAANTAGATVASAYSAFCTRSCTSTIAAPSRRIGRKASAMRSAGRIAGTKTDS